MSADVESVAICESAAALCTCTLPAGHDDPHACDPHYCGGRWTGVFGSDDFRVLAFPDPSLREEGDAG